MLNRINVLRDCRLSVAVFTNILFVAIIRRLENSRETVDPAVVAAIALSMMTHTKSKANRHLLLVAPYRRIKANFDNFIFSCWTPKLLRGSRSNH